MTDPLGNRRWRLLSVPAKAGAENMARDMALLGRARETGETVFSVYGWSRPTLSLGRNQRAAGCFDLNRLGALGIDVVRRPTGGRSLLHYREVTYSVTGPVESGDTLSEAYQRVNRILLEGLTLLGVDASVAEPGGRAERPTDMPCFATPSQGELIHGGRKLVGSAQWREEGAFLQHGSILIEDDQSMIAGFSLGEDAVTPIPGPATLAAALGRVPAPDEIRDALFDAVRRLEDSDATPLDESDVRTQTLAELPHFENELWTWRR